MEFKSKRPKAALKSILQDVADGSQLMMKGKLSLAPHNIKGKDSIKRIFEKLG